MPVKLIRKSPKSRPARRPAARVAIAGVVRRTAKVGARLCGDRTPVLGGGRLPKDLIKP